MPTYAYECPRCGPFDARRPMAEADQLQSCATCQTPSRRMFSAPAFHPASPLNRALDASHRSAHDPDVVTVVPQARRTAPPRADPRQAQLPRP